MELSQNMRYAVGTIDRALRTAGAGVANQQPMFIYGGNDVVAFNSNFTNVNQDRCAVNINPDAPVGSYEILPLASAADRETSPCASPVPCPALPSRRWTARSP